MKKTGELSLNMVLTGKEDGKIHRKYDDDSIHAKYADEKIHGKKVVDGTGQTSLKQTSLKERVEHYNTIDARLKKFTNDVINDRNMLNAESYLFGYKIGYSPEHYEEENNFILQKCITY